MGVVGRRRIHSRGRTRPAAARANSLRLHQKAHPMHALRRVDAGGGRNHDVEALHNMMTEGWCGALGRAEREAGEAASDEGTPSLN